MLTSFKKPIVEVCRVRLTGEVSKTKLFISSFLDSPAGREFIQNPAGAPGIFVVDPTKPLEGLQAFGFEGAEKLKELFAASSELDQAESPELEQGDLLLVQAREDVRFTGGATMFGKLRVAIQKAALAQGLIEHDASHQFLWVTDFPLFTLNDGSEPGQGGTSGFSSTHHPFTAPKTDADVDLLATDPLGVTGDHYDLVLNGVELGGGSRRIHNVDMQKYIMAKVLQVCLISPIHPSPFQP